MLLSLVYVSAAHRPLDAAEMSALLAQCRANNARLGITGMLLCADGNFMQALEGEAAEVAALFDRIATDPRHYLVQEMLRMPIAARQFGDWSMALRQLTDLPESERESCRQLMSTRVASPVPGSAGVVAHFLESFRQTMM